MLEAVHADGGESSNLNILHQNRINDTLDMFEEAGSLGLVAVIQDLRAKLDLANIDGITMAELQQRIDNATVGSEASSWGAMKARFGE